jgi:hypothetical protein
MKCECGEKLRLIVKNEEEVIYSINKDGSLELEDSRGVSQEFKLECSDCEAEYKFESDDWFEIQDTPQLIRRSYDTHSHTEYLVKENMNKIKIVKTLDNIAAHGVKGFEGKVF